jgi:endoglucanase
VNLGRLARSNPGGAVPPRLFELLDLAVAWADRNGLRLVIDNHTQEDDSSLAPDLEQALPVLWTQVATHFKDGPDSLVYEIFNEPHDIAAKDWDRIQRAALAAIRKVDRRHAVIVTGADWGGIDGLVALRPYDDPRLIYSFHFYDPFIFTHQGASWVGQEGLSGLSFPPDPARLPTIVEGPERAAIERDVRDYLTGDPLGRMKAQLDKAVDWARRNKARIYCGEMGANDETADPADRARWYRFTRGLLEERAIPFTSWDYRGSFGLFKRGSVGDFSHDLDLQLVSALGLKAPAQTPWVKKPETRGFPIYSDVVARGLGLDLNPGGGTIDPMSADRPTSGSSCLRLTGLGQYGSVSFLFRPEKDLALLVAGKASLRFWVRGDRPGKSLDLRFVMGTSPADDRPWRMSYRLGAKGVAWDGQWHEVSVPLSAFAESGAWNGAWFEPEGRFEWARVERFEIVAEESALGPASFWFNGIEVSLP